MSCRKTGLEFLDANVVQLNRASSGGTKIWIVFSTDKAFVSHGENLFSVDRGRDNFTLHHNFHAMPFVSI